MSGGFVLSQDFCNGKSVGVATGTNYGTSITTGAANTLGSWTQIIASTAADCCWIHVGIKTSASFNDMALQLGVGGAGSEVVIWNNLYFATDSTSHQSPVWFSFPCSIPSGTRIAIRAQSQGASDTCNVTLQLFDGAYTSIDVGGVEAIGFSSGTTLGTAITAPGTTNTKGSYVQLTASTARDYLGFSVSAGNFSPAGPVDYYLDIAIGGAGSEVIILPDLYICAEGFGFLVPTTIFPIPIPSGTRIAARLSTNGGTTATFNMPLTLNGIYQ